jgi:hypothetical protein
MADMTITLKNRWILRASIGQTTLRFLLSDPDAAPPVEVEVDAATARVLMDMNALGAPPAKAQAGFR